MVWALHFFLFNGFQKRRFGIFPAAVSPWLRHKTCWGSAFSHARPKHLFLEFGLVACRLPSLTLRCALLEATFRNLFSLFLVGSKNNVSALFWLRFRMVWALYFFLFWAHYTSFFLVGSKSDVSAFFWLRFRNGFGTKPAGALLFRMRSRRSFLGLCLVAAVSQWLGHDFIVFRGSKRNVFRMRSRRSFLGLCLVAAVSQWLGHDFIVFRGSKSNTFSLFLGIPKSNVSRFLRLHSCNGLDAKPAGALLFRMRSRRSFLGLCLVAAVSQWLGNDFIVFGGSKSNTFSLFFIVFRGAKSNVSRFLRLYSCNGLDTKPAGALLFRMRSRRSFLGFCLVAAVLQWLGHDFIVFRNSKSNVSRFLRLHSCNGLDAKPAGALLFRMRSRRIFLRLCPVAEVSPMQLSDAALKFSTGF